MAFSPHYYEAPNAPAPDWGSLVHANQGKVAGRQAAVNALVQLASENQRLKAQNAQHQAEVEQHASDQAAVQSRFQQGEANQAARESSRDQALMDRQTREAEDRAAQAEQTQESYDNRAMLRQAGEFLRTHYQQQQMNERAQMEQQARAQAAEQHRQEMVAKLEQVKKRNEAMQGAMVALTDAAKNFTESHDFTAAEVSPFYSPDPARMIQSIKGSKFMAGKEETPEDVYNNMLKAKVNIRVAPEGWFAQTLKPFAADLTPEDQMSLAKYAHGEDMVPYAVNSAEARSRAVDFFKGHSGLAPLFQGSTSSQAAPPKEAVSQSAKNKRSLAMMEYKQNLQFASLPLTGKADVDAMIQKAKDRNAELEQQLTSDEEKGEPAGHVEKSEGELSPEEQATLDKLLGGEKPK